jgi:nucleoid-associated protein Lsr2
MVQRVTTMLIDDLDHSNAAETVHFGVDGSAYEIDLSARHASELRSRLGRYISAARRIRQAPTRARQQRRPRPRTQMDREQSRQIRSWAMERGLLASPRGRIPQRVAEEYQAAMRVSPAPFRSPGAAGPQPASRGSRAKPASRRRAPGGAAEGGKTTATAHGGPKARVTAAGTSGLSEREQRELRSIADTARPAQNLVAGRLRKRGLADRDSAGNWRLTDAGKHAIASS